MLNRASRPLGSASHVYICVSCRSALTESSKAQIRRQSNVATTAATNSDSWFDTINQINDDFHVGKFSRPKDSQSTRNNPRAAKDSEKAAKPKKSEKTASKGAKSGNAPPTRATEPLTIAEKVREAKTRAKWGGVSEERHSLERAKSRPSHDSLRKADRVSPEAVIESAINKRPYGFCEDSVEQEDTQAEVDAPSQQQDGASSKRTQTRREIRARRISKRSSASSAEPVPIDSSSNDADSATTPLSLEEALTGKQRPQQATKQKKPSKKTPSAQKATGVDVTTEIDRIHAFDLDVQPLDIPQPPVPYLEYGLDRVLFSPGVHQLQDPTSRVYNFDPYLQQIMPVTEFDFNALKEYKTSSEDRTLANLAEQHGKKYIGSTSSMTACLAHFHHLLSSFRPLNLDMLTKNFNQQGHPFTTFTVLSRAPSAIFLRWKDGTYAIDADKEFDSGNVLMLLGKSMELLLTQSKSDYERYRKSDPRQVPEEQRTAPESYQYTTMGDFLMRSQLDAYDPRLPDNGTFDLKTRAVVSVRMDAQNYEPMTGYELYTLQGKWGSFEREYFDMMRATMLKYMLQARMGRMNGIFVAYHNVKRIFGFQYVPMRDMDLALHGQTEPALGDQEFRVSLELLNKLLNKATAKFPRQSLRFHFEARQDTKASPPLTSLHVFAEPVTEDEVKAIQGTAKAKIEEFERTVMGLERPASKLVDGAAQGDEEAPADSASVVDGSVASNPTDTASSTSQETAPGAEAGPAKGDLKPLFYASLLVKSKINDVYIGGERPEKLSHNDKWTVEYLLQEYDVGHGEWAAYEAMKSRRREAYKEAEAEPVDEPVADDSKKKENYYIKFLQDMAAKGETLRQRIDALEEGKVPVVVGKPLPRLREKVDGVDDYLRELYGGR